MPINKPCKNCGHIFEADRDERVFCSRACSNSFNTKGRPVSEEQKMKSSISLKRWWSEHPSSKKAKERICEEGKKSQIGKRRAKNLGDISNRTAQKILKRLNVKCFVCGWDKAACDLHHIIPKKQGGSNDHKNLTVLCPNCHRLAHRNLLDISNLPNIEEKFGDSWLEMYYG